MSPTDWACRYPTFLSHSAGDWSLTGRPIDSADAHLQGEPQIEARRGRLIKTLRGAKHWTQDDLARATGVSRSAVAQWETDRSSYEGKAQRIAHALDVPISDIMSSMVQSDDMKVLPAHEYALLRLFRQLSRDYQAAISRIVAALARQH